MLWPYLSIVLKRKAVLAFRMYNVVNIEELYLLVVAITPPPGLKEMLNLIKSRPQVEKLFPALF